MNFLVLFPDGTLVMHTYFMYYLQDPCKVEVHVFQ